SVDSITGDGNSLPSAIRKMTILSLGVELKFVPETVMVDPGDPWLALTLLIDGDCTEIESPCRNRTRYSFSPSPFVIVIAAVPPSRRIDPKLLPPGFPAKVSLIPLFLMATSGKAKPLIVAVSGATNTPPVRDSLKKSASLSK